MSILLICTSIVFVSACIVFVSTKRISANVYIKTVRVHEGIPDDERHESPYSLCRAEANNGSQGFTILKNNRHMYIAGTSNSFDVFPTLAEALKMMNTYEHLDGVKITSLNF